MMADDMVVIFSIDAFACDELLAGHLVGFGGLRQPASSRESSLVSSTGRILYQFVDSDTGCDKEVDKGCFGCILEVMLKTCPAREGGGISECALNKVSVKIKVADASSKKYHPRRMKETVQQKKWAHQ